MEMLVGTSGFSYSEWKGTFYPSNLSDGDMLTSYSERLPTVEINNTFYRMPQPALLEGWSGKVTSTGFRFALKAPRSITHIARLKEAAEGAGHFLKVASLLGPRLGPVLFQLPPFLRKDAAVLRDFLALLPPGTLAAFEFRHASWFDDETATILADKGAALVAGDPDEGEPLPLVPTAAFGYLRLRAPSYDAGGLERWHSQIVKQPWQQAFVYLKHEVFGPLYAQALVALSRGETPALPTAPVPPPLERRPRKKALTKAEPPSTPRKSMKKTPAKKK